MTVGVQGVATLTFDAAPQAAVYKAVEVVTDTVPQPNPNTYGRKLIATGVTNAAWVVASGSRVVTVPSGTGSWTSTDGVNWTAGTMPSGASWKAPCFGNGLFFCAAGGSASAATTVNGTTWTPQTLPSAGNWVGSAYGAGLYVVVQGSSLNFATSPDTITWTPRANASVQFGANAGVKFLNGTFWALGQNRNILTSTDGITFTNNPSVFPATGATFYNDLAYGNGTYVAIGNALGVAGVTSCATSTDGLTWTEQAGLPNYFTWTKIDFADGMFFTAGDALDGISGMAWAQSPDGVNWQISHNSGIIIVNNVAFGSMALSFDISGRVFSQVPIVSPGANVRTVSTVNKLVTPAMPSPGSSSAFVSVTGQTSLLATDSIDVWIQGTDYTASHNMLEHKLAPIKLSVMNVVPGVGFDIVGFSDQRLTGDFKVRWVWAR